MLGSAIFVHEHRVSARDGVVLACRETRPAEPIGVPVLCLPGLARNADDFDELAARIATHHQRRVFAPDYRGRGNSAWDKNAKNYRPEVYLDDLSNLMTALDLHQVVVIGTSMGGLIAMAMGVAMPSALVGVILNDIGPEIETNGLSAIVDYLSNPPNFKAWPDAIDHIKVVLPSLAVQNEAGWETLARATFREGGDGLLHPAWDPKIIVPLKAGAELPDLWPLFKSLGRIPVLVIRGGNSDILSGKTLCAMSEVKPDLNTVIVLGQGHAPLLNEPECEETIDGFLRSLP